MTAFHVQPILIVLLRDWILLTKISYCLDIISQDREYWAKVFFLECPAQKSLWLQNYFLEISQQVLSEIYIFQRQCISYHKRSFKNAPTRWDPLNKKGSPKLLFQVSKEVKFMHIKIKQPVVHKFDLRITLSSWTDDLPSHTLRRVKQLSKC